ncbi:MAG TPA: ABC transporter substrate-binding protein [Calidithermus sp.]|nr:ABC transporter substrate-binding protein [Calidithermus sp.]
MTMPKGLAVAMVLGLVLASSGAGMAQVRGGTLRVGQARSPVSLDPHLGVSLHEFHVLYALFEGLVAYDDQLGLRPGLAESWQRVDPRTWVFRLRRGVKFHDGTDFDAASVKWNVERIKNPETKARVRDLDVVDEVEVVDSHTVRFRLNTPTGLLPTFLAERGGLIVSPTAVRRLGPEHGRQPVGTGPYRFVEWKADDHITLARWDQYWDRDAAYLDRIVYRLIPDESILVTNLRAGQIDLVMDVPPKDLGMLRRDANLTVLQRPGLGFYWINLNSGAPPFDNRAVRQALTLAIDRPAMLRSLYFGAGAPAAGPVAPVSWAFDAGLKPPARDLDGARRKLAEAGLPNGFTFKMLVGATPMYRTNATAVQAQLAEIGVKVELEIAETVKVLQQVVARTYQASSTIWIGLNPDPDLVLHPLYHSQGLFNRDRYRNARVDELLDRARTTEGLDERRRLYQEAVRLITADAADLWLYHPDVTAAMSRRVRGVPLAPDGRLRIRGAWLER